MEYRKIINLLNDTTNQPSKFSTRNWVETNDESKGKYNNSNIRLKTFVIRSTLCDYSDAFIRKGTITVPKTTAAGAAVNSTNKNVILTNCASFILIA